MYLKYLNAWQFCEPLSDLQYVLYLVIFVIFFPLNSSFPSSYYLMLTLHGFRVEPREVKLPPAPVINVIMYPDRGCGIVPVIHEDYEVK